MAGMTTTEQFRKMYRHDNRVAALKAVGLRIMCVAVVPSLGMAALTLIRPLLRR